MLSWREQSLTAPLPLIRFPSFPSMHSHYAANGAGPLMKFALSLTRAINSADTGCNGGRVVFIFARIRVDIAGSVMALARLEENWNNEVRGKRDAKQGMRQRRMQASRKRPIGQANGVRR